MKLYEINGRAFEEMTTPATIRDMMAEYSWYQFGKTYKDIYEAYSRPSITKAKIFYDWQKFVGEVGGSGLRIVHAGCQTFSLGFEFLHPETKELCYALVTKTYNRFCKII